MHNETMGPSAAPGVRPNTRCLSNRASEFHTPSKIFEFLLSFILVPYSIFIDFTLLLYWIPHFFYIEFHTYSTWISLSFYIEFTLFSFPESIACIIISVFRFARQRATKNKTKKHRQLIPSDTADTNSLSRSGNNFFSTIDGPHKVTIFIGLQ